MQLAISAAGAGIGFMIGGPAGAKWGWMAGSMIGSALFPSGQDMQGPRLTDLSAPSSTYGSPIPEDYGTVRHSGVTIWESGIIEHSHEESQGKGDSPTYTTYTYTRHFAIALCNGEIDGVSRIWRNSALIYDVTPGNNGTTGITGNIRIYTGSEIQLPDSLLEGYLGADDTPAYRGTAYVVFEDHDVTDINGRVPIFSFEIVKNGDTAIPATATWGQWSSGHRFLKPIPDKGQFFALDSIDGNVVNLWNAKTKTIIKSYDSGWTGGGDYIAGIGYCPTNNTLWMINDYSGASQFRVFDVDTGAMLHDGPRTYSEYLNGATVLYDQIGQQIVVYRAVSGIIMGWKADINTYAVETISTIFSGGWTHVTGGLDLSGEDYLFIRFYSYGMALVNKGDLSAALIHDFGTYACNPVHDAAGRRLFFVVNANAKTQLYVVDMYAPFLQLVQVAELNYDGVTLASFSVYDDVIWVGYAAANLLVAIDPDDGSVVRTMTSTGQPTPGEMVSYVLPTRPCRLLVGGPNQLFYDVRLCAELTPQPVTLASIVSGRCLQSGLTAGEIDVTQLTDLVHGYTVGNPMTGRASIEPLQTAYFFDAVESEGKIKFVKRGGASVATIPVDDLAAHEWGQAMPDDMVLARKQEVELPQQVSVVYADINMDYQPGAQYSRRLTGESIQQVGLQLPISMDADKAQQVADVNLYAAWEERNTAQITVSRKWSHIEPTDVVDLLRNDVAYRLRIVKKDEGAPGLIKLDVVTEATAIGATAESDAYTSTSTGVQGSFTPQTIAELVNTRLVLLDIAMLRDEDNDAGFYAVATGTDSGWPGAQLFKSADDITYTAILSLPDAAAVGYVSGTLGDFAGGNVFDTKNVITVILQNGTLSSTSELEVLNGANAAAIGSEIVQFKTATLVAANTYEVSGFLRGRRGTEWAVSSHTSGERFVLASSATWRRVPMPTSEIGLLRYWKGVTFGQQVSAVNAQTLTNGGAGLECYAPIIWGSGADASGNITFGWIRRNRTSGEWRDYIDVPMTEASESYDVEICSRDFSTVKRTFAGMTSASCSYTAANQITDWGTLISIVPVRIYQNSALVGRGYVEQDTFYTQTVTPFALTFDSSQHSGGIVLSESNRLATEGWYTDYGYSALADVLESRSVGKWYAEFEIANIAAGSVMYVGIAPTGYSMAEGSYMGLLATSAGYHKNGTVKCGGATVATISAYVESDIIRVAYDADTGKVWFGRNGTWGGSGDPGAGTGQQATITTGATNCGVTLSSGDSIRFLNNCYYDAPAGFSFWN